MQRGCGTNRVPAGLLISCVRSADDTSERPDQPWFPRAAPRRPGPGVLLKDPGVKKRKKPWVFAIFLFFWPKILGFSHGFGVLGPLKGILKDPGGL